MYRSYFVQTYFLLENGLDVFLPYKIGQDDDIIRDITLYRTNIVWNFSDHEYLIIFTSRGFNNEQIFRYSQKVIQLAIFGVVAFALFIGLLVLLNKVKQRAMNKNKNTETVSFTDYQIA